MSVLYKNEKRVYHPKQDKVVVITGAASGIGEGIAINFAENGYKKMVLVSFFGALTLDETLTNASG